MQKEEICRRAAKKAGITHQKMKRYFNACLKAIEESLIEGDKIYLHPIGVFKVTFDHRPHINRRVVKLQVSPRFNRLIGAAQVEFPKWYTQLVGEVVDGSESISAVDGEAIRPGANRGT